MAIRLLLLLLLTGCVTAPALRVPPGFEAIALQRMRFAAEAVCLNNRTRAAQERAAGRLDFPVRDRDGDAVIYVNPGTLTFLRIGPAPDQTVSTPTGEQRTFGGSGCSVGSPAVGIRAANRAVGEILAPRLIDGSDTLAGPLGGGRNPSGGVGLFFDDLSVTLPIAETTITNPETGRDETFLHPVILIIHS